MAEDVRESSYQLIAGDVMTLVSRTEQAAALLQGLNFDRTTAGFVSFAIAALACTALALSGARWMHWQQQRSYRL